MKGHRRFKLEKSRYVAAPGPSLMAHVGVGSPGMGTPQPTVRFITIFYPSTFFHLVYF